MLLPLLSLMSSLFQQEKGRSGVIMLADLFTFIFNLVSTTGNGTPHSYLQDNAFSSIVEHIYPANY